MKIPSIQSDIMKSQYCLPDVCIIALCNLKVLPFLLCGVHPIQFNSKHFICPKGPISGMERTKVRKKEIQKATSP